MANPSPLKGESVEEIKDRINFFYPKGTQITRVEKVVTGGVFGLLAKTHYEAHITEPSDPLALAGAAGPVKPTGLAAGEGIPSRKGINALLNDAHASEALLHGVELPNVSTRSSGLGTVLNDMVAVTASAATADTSPQLPTPAGNPGDLIVVVGLGNDAFHAAESIARSLKAVVRSGGSTSTGGVGRTDDRNSAVTARAEGVLGDFSTVVAYGLGTQSTAAAYLKALPAVGADQVWLAVDASRKAEDTAAWVGKVRKTVPVYALAVINSEETASSRTVNDLGIPVGWLDGTASTRTVI